MIFGRTLGQLLDCVIYRKTVNSNDVENMQIELGRLRGWAVENGMKISGKSKAVSFTRARGETSVQLFSTEPINSGNE